MYDNLDDLSTSGRYIPFSAILDSIPSPSLEHTVITAIMTEVQQHSVMVVSVKQSTTDYPLRIPERWAMINGRFPSWDIWWRMVEGAVGRRQARLQMSRRMLTYGALPWHVPLSPWRFSRHWAVPRGRWRAAVALLFPTEQFS